jgi:hypothetical protein
MAGKSLANHSPWQINHCEIISPGKQIILKPFDMAGKSLANHFPWQINHCQIIPPGKQIILKSLYPGKQIILKSLYPGKQIICKSFPLANKSSANHSLWQILEFDGINFKKHDFYLALFICLTSNYRIMASNTNKYKVMNYQACRPAVL